jgi:hypothetical protein
VKHESPGPLGFNRHLLGANLKLGRGFKPGESKGDAADDQTGQHAGYDGRIPDRRRFLVQSEKAHLLTGGDDETTLIAHFTDIDATDAAR